MHTLIAALRSGSRILDLGSEGRSFPTDRDDLTIVRLNPQARATGAPGSSVAADAANMPFASGSFDLVVINRRLDAIPRLEAALADAGRVLTPDGALFLAVPDSGAPANRIYRWMGRSREDVNAFRSPEEVTRLVERATGLPHRATRALFSSLSFLNARHRTGRPQIKSALFAFGNERFLAIVTWMLHRIDDRFGTRMSRYGWSFYFSQVAAPNPAAPWVNVCVRCGAGHSESYLKRTRAIQAWPGWLEWYRCPDCGGSNLFVEADEADTAERRLEFR